MNKWMVLSVVTTLVLPGRLTSQQTAAEGTGLIAYWSFDEGEGDTVSDSSGDENHGTIKGGAEWVRGVKGTALRFNGQDARVEIPASPSLRSPRELSIEAWIFPIYPQQQGYGGIINNINGASHSRLLLMDNGKLIAQLHGTEGNDTVSVPKVKNNQWNHVVYVYNGEEETWYLNGVEAPYFPYTEELPAGRATITIGWGHTTPENYHFNGIIDEVKIYSRALAIQEIQKKCEEIQKKIKLERKTSK